MPTLPPLQQAAQPLNARCHSLHAAVNCLPRAAPWHGLLRRRGAPPPAWGWRRDPPGLVLRFFWFGTTAALLWICHLDPQEFQVGAGRRLPAARHPQA